MAGQLLRTLGHQPGGSGWEGKPARYPAIRNAANREIDRGSLRQERAGAVGSGRVAAPNDAGAREPHLESDFLLTRDGPGCRLTLAVVGDPIRGWLPKLAAEPARKVTGRGKAEEIGDLIQLAFAVGQKLLGEFSPYSIDDRRDTLTLRREVPVQSAAMHAKMLGYPFDGTKPAWQQHPDDLARALHRLVVEVGQLQVQRSLYLAMQRRVCSRDRDVQIAAPAYDGVEFL